MQVRGEMESARVSQIRPCSNIPRQRVRRESDRSFSHTLAMPREHPVSETPQPNNSLMLQCEYAAVVFLL
jgi:hypothetical protein